MSKTTNKFSPEVRERAVRLVFDNEGQHASRWQAVMSISAKIGCTPQTLNDWVKKAEVDSGKRAGVPTDMAERIKALERENRELRQANEILRKASAYFAMAELVLWDSRLLMQKGAAAQHRKLRGSGGGGVVRSLVFQDRGRV
jgi:transposase